MDEKLCFPRFTDVSSKDMPWWIPLTEEAGRQMRSRVEELASVGQVPEGVLGESSLS